MSDTQKKIELAPCPFCGVIPEIFKGYPESMNCWRVIHSIEHCVISDVLMGDYPTREEATKAWNTRPARNAMVDEEKLKSVIRNVRLSDRSRNSVRFWSLTNSQAEEIAHAIANHIREAGK